MDKWFYQLPTSEGRYLLDTGGNKPKHVEIRDIGFGPPPSCVNLHVFEDPDSEDTTEYFALSEINYGHSRWQALNES